jgi:copper transport protein
MKRRLLLTAAVAWAALIVLLLVLIATDRAGAHAYVVRTDPPEGAVLERGPALVEIEFSEDVASGQSHINVFATDGRRVDRDDTIGVPGNPRVLRVSVADDLPDGAYTVAWRNLSDVDGHLMRGAFVFFIGSDEFVAAEIDTGAGEGLTVAGETATRWATFLGLVLLAGAPWAFALVLAPVVPSDERREVRGNVEALAIIGGGVVLLAAAAQLVVKLAETGGGGSALLFETRWGTAWLVRVSLVAVALSGWLLLRRLPRSLRRLPTIAGLGAALSLSLASHGAAASEIGLVAGLIDGVHVLATMAWGGGLVAFLVLLRHSRSDRTQSGLLAAAIPRFTILGVLATLALALTGSYAAWIHVGSPEGFATDYGRGVASKLLLLAALAAVAAVNTTWVRRRIAHPRDVGRGATWLRRLVRAEVALIALALAASAFITSLAPARQQVESAGQFRVVDESTHIDVGMRATIEPGRLGANTVTVDLERGGSAYDAATAVLLFYRNLGTPVSGEVMPLREVAPGSWRLDDPAMLSVDGVYEFTFRVQRLDGLDIRHALRFETRQFGSTGGLPPRRAWWGGVAVLGLVGVAMVGANAIASRRRVLRGEALGWSGAGLVAVAVILAAQAPAASATGNPIPADAQSLDRGAAIYATHCARCHGDGLRGDGPDATLTSTPPADLTIHMPMHTDAEHFAIIAGGMGEMPAFARVLEEEDVWDVLNFLRAEAAERPSMPLFP